MNRAQARSCCTRKSNKAWEVGKSLADSNSFNGAANRCYYAMFHAARVWADQYADVNILQGTYKGIHESMVMLVGKRGGEHARDMRDSLNNMMGLRITADYEFEDVTSEDFAEELRQAGAVRIMFLK